MFSRLPECSHLVVFCSDPKSEPFQNASNYFSDVTCSVASVIEESGPAELKTILDTICKNVHWSLHSAAGSRVVALGSTQQKRQRAGRLGLAVSVALARPELKSQFGRAFEQLCVQAECAGLLTRPPAETPPPVVEQCMGDELVLRFESEADHRYPSPRMSHYIEQMRLGGVVIPRKSASAILKSRVDEWRSRLLNGEQSVVEDLTDSGRPWAEILAGVSDKLRGDLVGSGVVRFRIEMHHDELCPYEKLPQINIVVQRSDGTECLHHPHRSSDEELRYRSSEGASATRTTYNDKYVHRSFFQ